jgi:hypothetical protein
LRWGIGGVSVFLDAMLDVARLCPCAPFEGFASGLSFQSLPQLLQALLYLPELVL